MQTHVNNKFNKFKEYLKKFKDFIQRKTDLKFKKRKTQYFYSQNYTNLSIENATWNLTKQKNHKKVKSGTKFQFIYKKKIIAKQLQNYKQYKQTKNTKYKSLWKCLQ